MLLSLVIKDQNNNPIEIRIDRLLSHLSDNCMNKTVFGM